MKNGHWKCIALILIRGGCGSRAKRYCLIAVRVQWHSTLFCRNFAAPCNFELISDCVGRYRRLYTTVSRGWKFSRFSNSPYRLMRCFCIRGYRCTGTSAYWGARWGTSSSVSERAFANLRFSHSGVRQIRVIESTSTIAFYSLAITVPRYYYYY